MSRRINNRNWHRVAAYSTCLLLVLCAVSFSTPPVDSQTSIDSYDSPFVYKESTPESPPSFAELTVDFDGEKFFITEKRRDIDHRPPKVAWVTTSTGSYATRIHAIGRTENDSLVNDAVNSLSGTRMDPTHFKAQQSAMLADHEISKGNWVRARAEYEKALNIWIRLNDRFRQAQMLSGLGTAQYELGDLQKSLDNHQRAMKLFQSLSARSEEVRSLISISSIYESSGRLNQALETYQQALRCSREINDKQAEAIVLESLGRFHELRGELQSAFDLFQQSLAISSSVNDHQAQAYAQLALGQLHSSLGERQIALDYLKQARDNAGQLEARFAQPLRLSTLLAIGQVYRASGDHEKALDVLRSAMNEGRSIRHARHTASAMYNLGLVYDELGDHGNAKTRYMQALAIAQRVNDISQESSILKSLGQHYYSQGLLNQAKDTLNRALSQARTIGDNLSETGILYSLALVQREQDDLDSSKQLIEQAINLIVSLRRNITSRNLRLSYFASVQKYYEFYIDLLMALHRQRPREGYDRLALSASERARSQSLVDSFMDAALGRQSSRSGVQRTFQSLNSSEIQLLLRNENVLLLEYSLGEKRSFLWAVTKESLKTFELPGRAAIEELVRDLYGSLKQPTPKASYSDYLTRATALSDVLLRPVQNELSGKKLLIVADGSLQMIPFEALVSPSTKEPLVFQHEVVNLPSATIYALLREQSAKRKRATRLLAVLADPVFDRDDPRVSQVKTIAPEPARHSLPRLYGAKWEAERIMALSPERSKIVVGFEANRDAILDGLLNDYQIVHFATHGLVDAPPNVSGIVLSLVDEEGKSRNGVLGSDDISKLRLSADLVVLSSCVTTQADGINGVTNSFFNAGAQSVVTSLWRVDDIATADLMTRFYKWMLRDRLPPAAALRRAKMEMWQEGEWRHPYYWAGFTLQGEADFDVHPVQTRNYLIALMVIALPMGGCFIAFGIAFSRLRNRPKSRSTIPSLRKV